MEKLDAFEVMMKVAAEKDAKDFLEKNYKNVSKAAKEKMVKILTEFKLELIKEEKAV